uniref:Pentacotripeptide-repeat region of PRORP domain-containing protein n=1 Tax=Arundo donax TaxID=35708 RepID=A0A0A9A1R2_ARUDO
MEHCSSVVTMLSKAGMISEAYEFMSKQTSLNSDPTILRVLLRACSVHGNTRIGDIVANRLFDLEPENEHNFVLLMRIYQNTGRLEDAENAKMLRDRGL